MARSALAQIKALTGDEAGAAALIEPVLRLIEGVDDVFVPGLDQAVAMLSVRKGDHQAAIASLRHAARSTDRGTETWIAGRALPGLGAALAAVDRRDEATTVLDRAVAVAQRLQLPGSLAEAYAAQADLAAAEPDGPTRAVDLHHLALTIRVDHRLRAAQPDSLEALARHGSAIQPSLDHVRILYAARSARAAMGLPRSAYQQQGCEAVAAGLRQALGEPGFDGAAAEGAQLTLDEAVAYARRARGRRNRPSTGWASLTPTEREVVRLVADGLTNPQIGARLFISAAR
jgi:ATP/maltotriose-dependent transcriptional regulator MalT